MNDIFVCIGCLFSFSVLQTYYKKFLVFNFNGLCVFCFFTLSKRKKKLSTKNVLVLNYCFNKNKVTCRDQVIDTFIMHGMFQKFNRKQKIPLSYRISFHTL